MHWVTDIVTRSRKHHDLQPTKGIMELYPNVTFVERKRTVSNCSLGHGIYNWTITSLYSRMYHNPFQFGAQQSCSLNCPINRLNCPINRSFLINVQTEFSKINALVAQAAPTGNSIRSQSSRHIRDDFKLFN